ncbi:MAG: hypothetical protein R2909_15300 [Gemmatimonadales bacterium]
MRSGWLAGLLLIGGATSTWDIPLRNTETAPTAKGTARLVYAASPFGVAVTADGVASYDVQLELSGLPAPASLGDYRAYVAWAASVDLKEWHRLGTVRNGSSTVGQAELNKFLLVITAEADSLAATRTGPTILHGPSPSTWLQSFLSHPLFRGIPPG